MNCSALVLVFLCLVYAHLCARTKRKTTFGKRVTPPRLQFTNRLFQAKFLRPSEFNANRQGLRRFAQQTVKKEAGTKARVFDASDLKNAVVVGAAFGLAAGVPIGLMAGVEWDLDPMRRAMNKFTNKEGGLHWDLRNVTGSISERKGDIAAAPAPPSDTAVMQAPASSRTSGAETSRQTFPPIKIDSRDSRQLLCNWADSSKAPDPLPEIYDNAKVCCRLRDVVAIVDRSPDQLKEYATGLEMVGMVPKASLHSGSSAVALESLGALDVSVQALGVFSRETVEDDHRGSLREQIEEHYENGKQLTRGHPDDPWGGPKKQFDVFAIEGLADVPGFSESSARVLMAKIAQYAEKEQKVVVVPVRAYKREIGGSDLSMYYERLGFKKVELDQKAWRTNVLLYVGDALAIDKVSDEAIRAKKIAQDESVENQQMMIGMSLWTGL